MDWIFILAEGASQAASQAVVSDGIFKYVAGGMGVGMGAMAIAIKTLYTDVKTFPNQIKEMEQTCRDEWKEVVSGLNDQISDKDAEILRLLKEQITHGQKEIKSFSEMADDINETLKNDIAPVMGETCELLGYYRKKREKQ